MSRGQVSSASPQTPTAAAGDQTGAPAEMNHNTAADYPLNQHYSVMHIRNMDTLIAQRRYLHYKIMFYSFYFTTQLL